MVLQHSYISPLTQFIYSTSYEIINLLEENRPSQRIHGKTRESVSVWGLREFKPLRTQPSHCTGLTLAPPPTLHLSALGLDTATASANGCLYITTPKSKSWPWTSGWLMTVGYNPSLVDSSSG